MLFVIIMTPVTMILFGYIFYKSPPKEINMLYGYRTSMSTKNNDTWQFAHKYCGKLWVIIGLILLVVSVATMLFVTPGDEGGTASFGNVLAITHCIILIASVIPVEIALRKNFDKQGNRR